jgi:hypothetical protein
MALTLSLDDFLKVGEVGDAKLDRCHSEASSMPPTPVLRISLDGFLSPGHLEEAKFERCDSEASSTPKSPSFRILLDGFVTPSKVEEGKFGRYDSEASTAPSTPALRISLDEVLSPHKVGEARRGRCDSDASTVPSSPETPSTHKMKLQLHNHTLVKGSIVFPPASETGEQKLYQEAVSLNDAEPIRSKINMKRFRTGIPSRGSKNHSCGKCRPCNFLQEGRECPNGALCNFCHYPHREIPRKVSFCDAFMTTESQTMQKTSQCEPCLSVPDDDAPWFIEVPKMSFAS